MQPEKAIDIPADYWTIRPAGFALLVQPFNAGLDTLIVDIVSGAEGMLGGQDDETRSGLANVDGDADAIAAAAAGEYSAIVNTPTNDVLGAYGAADTLTAAADAARPAGIEPGGPQIPDPPIPPNVSPGDGPSDSPRFPEDPDNPTRPPSSVSPRPEIPEDGNNGGDGSGDDSGKAPGDVSAESAGAPLSAAAETAPTDDGGTSESAPSPDDAPVTRRQLLEALNKLSPTITVVV